MKWISVPALLLYEARGYLVRHPDPVGPEDPLTKLVDNVDRLLAWSEQGKLDWTYCRASDNTDEWYCGTVPETAMIWFDRVGREFWVTPPGWRGPPSIRTPADEGPFSRFGEAADAAEKLMEAPK